MKIEDIDFILRSVSMGDATLDYEDYKNIIAALKAGQAMRDEFEGVPEKFRSSIESRLQRTLAAWDAATKEGV